MVADFFEKWWKETGIDGFNVNCTHPIDMSCAVFRTAINEFTDISNPGSFEDVVELLIPELQKRGLYWDDYAVPGGTARENLQGTPGKPFLPKHHPAAKFRWSAQEEKAGGEKPKQPSVKVDAGEKAAEPVRN